jgi:high-affinity Fe2+/Pb2+ permease
VSEPHDPVPQRPTFVPLLLGVLGAGFLFVLLIFLTGGWFFYVGGSISGLVLLGLVHYVVWGRALSEQVAGEREEMELLERAREDEKGQKWTFRR